MIQPFFTLKPPITLEKHGEGWALARHYHGLGYAAGVFGVVPPEEGDQLIIAHKFGTAIGMATFYPGRSPGTVWLALLWVDPLFRRQGVAGALIEAVMDWGRAQNLSTLELGVYTHNAPMQQLMRQLGMQPKATMFAGPIRALRDTSRDHRDPTTLPNNPHGLTERRVEVRDTTTGPQAFMRDDSSCAHAAEFPAPPAHAATEVLP